MLKDEILCLPTPFQSFKYLYSTDMNLLGFYSWLFFSFVFTPALFFLFIVLWYLKHHIIEPVNIGRFFNICIAIYFNEVLNCFVVEFLVCHRLYINDIVLYTFLRFASAFPQNASSNMFFINLVLVLYAQIIILFFNIILAITIHTIFRFSHHRNLKRFVLKNWTFICGVFGIQLFYLINWVFVHRRVAELDVGTSYPVSHYISMDFVLALSLLNFNVLDTLFRLMI
ncbi:uncharacterized protein VICG_00410 [Vittaforma corneae ATCC 50505]|uniref:Uncharacterized protein n=1 Tax=Vittaforma corneae (strain ATCC 50505) TaxID=993615 RepID=L2GP51_VITCO|nr:uncharacterized protein VICG_00410 [Vittaforma corneae ATCC 50505]ELA42658.1 hypothetical protein VICG_00410 [Vittaforma corneae ATCC 50505]